jgi:hypothetical protein
MFVDWGFGRRSINLLDLDYVRSIPIQPAETDWWIIQPEEANAVLHAYFSCCGIRDVDVMSTHFAVMLWANLWALHQTLDVEKGVLRSMSRQRIDFLLGVRP